jgi:hypothetical protein
MADWNLSEDEHLAEIGWDLEEPVRGAEGEIGEPEQGEFEELSALHDFGEWLDVMIVQQWVRGLEGPYDWAQWPLGRYVFGTEFVRTVEAHRTVALERVAWVCAMVACELAPRLESLEPGTLMGEDGAPAVREDGAHGWRCTLADAGGGPRLHYWVHPNGLVEFESVGPVEECPVPVVLETDGEASARPLAQSQ